MLPSSSRWHATAECVILLLYVSCIGYQKGQERGRGESAKNFHFFSISRVSVCVVAREHTTEGNIVDFVSGVLSALFTTGIVVSKTYNVDSRKRAERTAVAQMILTARARRARRKMYVGITFHALTHVRQPDEGVFWQAIAFERISFGRALSCASNCAWVEGCI